MMTIDFLIGAIRASRDLHPQVKTELEDILYRPAQPVLLRTRCEDCAFFCPNNAEEGDMSGKCKNSYSACQNMTVDMAWSCGDWERK